MSDTRNHTTRDQLAAAFRSVAWLEYKDFDPEWAAFEKDALDALEPVIAAVRAAAVAETTAAIEALADKWERQEYKPGAFYPEAIAYADGRDNQAEVCADEIREVLSGGRTALDTTLAEAWDFGYACGLGDYGKSDDETQAANPYRADTGADQ